MPSDTAGKRVVLITDADHFVGKPSARALIEQGCSVYAADPGFTDDEAKAAFEAAVPGSRTLVGSDPGALVHAVVSAEGRLDVLINNDAYPALRAPVDEASDADLGATYEALLFKPFAMTRVAVPHMKAQGAGKVLFITSAAPLNGLANYSMYASARGAANALAISLSKELAPHNIQVNAMAPNYVDNPDYFPPELMAKPEAAAKILKNIPLGRLGRPEEAAALVSFLAGPTSDFVTGQVIAFAGGWASAR